MDSRAPIDYDIRRLIAVDTRYRESLKAVRYEFRVIWKLRNLTGAETPVKLQSDHVNTQFEASGLCKIWL